jgi:hypothetical protein
MYWDTQSSGPRIPPDVAAELERIWSSLWKGTARE